MTICHCTRIFVPQVVRDGMDVSIVSTVVKPVYVTKNHLVVEREKDLEWAIYRQSETGLYEVRRVPLDKYEAIRLCDEEEAMESRLRKEEQNVLESMRNL